MPQNIKITPASGLLEFIGNTLNVAATDFRLTVDPSGNITLTVSPLVKSYITNLGIDPNVLLGTVNQIGVAYSGNTGIATLSLPSAVIFPGTAQIAAVPSNPNDIANRAYVDANSNKRLTTRAIATTNINLASAPSSVDGVTLASGDRVLVTGQTSQPSNGIYVFAGTGNPMTRSTDFNTWAQVSGALVTVSQGTSFANTLWMSTSPLSGTIESTNITFKRVDSVASLPAGTGVVHSNGTILTASLIVDADVHDVAWNKITGIPTNITTQTLQSVTQNGNSTNQNIVLLSTGAPAAPVSGGALYADVNGSFGWVNSSGFAKLFAGTITASRTYTLPDANGIVILDAAIQTLSNKTLTAASTIINAGSDAPGDLYYRSSTGQLARLPLGTTGQVLGAGAGIPAWGNPSVTWSSITGTPTTLAGYGITDPVLLTTGGTMTGALTLAGDPTTPLMAATKQYVDNIALGLEWKNSVKASTAGVALPANTVGGLFQTLTANSNGPLPSIDGITLNNGDLILVMDEADQTKNGSYIVTDIGASTGPSRPWVLTRSSDSNTGPSLVAATYYIQSGTLFGNRVYTVSTPAPITLGSSPITFVQIAGANTYSNGAGLTLTGTVFSITTGGVTNAMLTNPSINLALGSTGTSPNWSGSGVALGGTATLNLPNASATNTGVLSASDWILFNSKLSSANAFMQGGNTYGATGVLGTNDAFDLTFIAHATEVMRIAQATGSVLIGTTTVQDSARLQVVGDVSVFGSVNTIPQIKLQKAANQKFDTPSILITDNLGATVATLFFNSSNQIITSGALVNGATFVGSSNTALGASTLLQISTGFGNTAVGNTVLGALTTGTWNTGFGASALTSLTIGGFNTAVGSNAGASLVSGSSNTFIGYSAGSNTVSGSNNVFVGYQTGANVTGSGNVLIGYQTGNGLTNISNRLYIANNSSSTLIYGEFDTQYMQIAAAVSIIAQSLTGSSNTSGFSVLQNWNTTGNPVLISANAVSTARGASSLLLSLNTNSIAQFTVDPVGNTFMAGGLTVGSIRLPLSTTTLGTIYKNNLPWVSSYSGGTTQDSNMFVGYQSGNLTNTGAGLNVSLGYNTLRVLTTGSENVALGANSLGGLTTGANNIAIGSSALILLTTGSGNVAIGGSVMNTAQTVGNNNVVIGMQAGTNSSGSGNVFIGFNVAQNEIGSNLLYIANSSTTTPLIWGDFTGQTMRVNGQLQVVNTNNLDGIYVKTAVTSTSTASLIRFVQSTGIEIARINGDTSNLFFGNAAGGVGAWTGGDNVGIGKNALNLMTSAAANVAVGSGALMHLTSGVSNVVVGMNGASSLTTGGNNIVIGQSALGVSTTGSSNIAIGSQALNSNVTGAGNVAIGFNAGFTNTGSGNIFIGYSAGNASAFSGISNQLIIANSTTATPLIQGNFSTLVFTLNSLFVVSAPLFTNVIAGQYANAVNIVQTWNAGTGAASLINATVTDTASAANSMLVRLTVNATDVFTINKTGSVYIKNGITADSLVAPVNAYQFLVWDTTTHTFGVVPSGGSGGSGFTVANNGLSSPTSSTVQFGQNTAGTTGVAQLNNDVYLPLNGHSIIYQTTVSGESITMRANYFSILAANNSKIVSDVTAGAVITMVDVSSGTPMIVMSNSAALPAGTVNIVNTTNTKFQIVESTQTAGFVYNLSNFRFGIKALNPQYDLDIAGNLGVTHSVTGASIANTFQGLTTWNTTSAVIGYNLVFNVAAALAGSKLFQITQDTQARVVVDMGAGVTNFQANGLRIQNNATGAGGISLNASAATANTLIFSAGFNLYQSDGISSSMPANIAQINTATLNPTSGTGNILNVIGNTFSTASGNAVVNWLQVSPTINQTGSATGITRALYINPTLTSAVDFRALEITNGTVYLPNLTLRPLISSTGPSIGNNYVNYIFTGSSTGSSTLPPPTIYIPGTMFFMKNRGTANWTINSAFSNQIYDQSQVSTFTIAPGDAYIFVNDGTYWNVE